MLPSDRFDSWTTALELSQDGKITKFTVVWDGSLLDEQAITALATAAVDNLSSALNPRRLDRWRSPLVPSIERVVHEIKPIGRKQS